MPKYRVARAVTKNGTYYAAGELVEVGESFGGSMTRLGFFKLAGDPKPKAKKTAKPSATSAAKPKAKRTRSNK